jgi:hypothetical protein
MGDTVVPQMNSTFVHNKMYHAQPQLSSKFKVVERVTVLIIGLQLHTWNHG